MARPATAVVGKVLKGLIDSGGLEGAVRAAAIKLSEKLIDALKEVTNERVHLQVAKVLVGNNPLALDAALRSVRGSRLTSSRIGRVARALLPGAA